MPDQPCPYCTPPRAVADALALVGLEQTSPPAPVPSREQLAHQLEQFQAAAAALVADMLDPNGDQVLLCGHLGCMQIAMYFDKDGDWSCDEHKTPGSHPTTYAAPLQALIALLPPVKP